MPCARPCSSSTSTSSRRPTTPAGYAAGDSILLTLSRRLSRLLQAAGYAGAHLGRRIRHHPAVRARARPDHRLRRHGPPRGDDPDHLCGARDLPHRLHRPRPARSADRRAARGGAAQRRDRHGPCQAPRRRPDRGVPPDHALRPQRPFHDGNRPSPRARPQRDEGAVQADRAAGGPHHRGLRVDAALGSSPARPDRPRGLHVDRRGNRPHRQSERVPAGADRAGNSRRGRTRSRSSRRSSPASTCRAITCCATICCRT